MNRFDIDWSRAPVVVVRLPARLDEPGLRAFFDEMEQGVHDLDALFVVMDATALDERPDAVMRRLAAEHQQALAAHFSARDGTVGEFIAVRSRPVRLALTAISWLTAHDRQVFATVDEAIAAALQRAEQAGGAPGGRTP